MKTPRLFAAETVLRCLLVVAAFPALHLTPVHGAGFSWQSSHATVTATGDLEWRPEAFVYAASNPIRYIDYEAGDDANSGESSEAPWKHHPWDPAAIGRAKETSGELTYVFKRGVDYRGELIADESGRPDHPIELTSDPSWGTGAARILGSIRIDRGWRRVRDGDEAGIPDASKVWAIDLDTGIVPRAVWQLDREGVARRIPIARMPDWEAVNPDDIKSQWWEWDTVGTAAPPGSDRVMNRASSSGHLHGPDLTGATIWSEWIPVMGTPHAAVVDHHDPGTGEVYFTGFFEDTNRMEPGNRFFLEDHPLFLDSPGEYYYAPQGPVKDRLYLRLYDDDDPNEQTVEVAQSLNTIDLRGHSHIHISGLEFHYLNVYDPTVRPRFHPDVHSAAIRSYGSSQDIAIRNCTFENVGTAIFLKAYGDGDHIDRIEVTDNLIRQTDHGAIHIENGTYYYRKLPGLGTLGDVRILRNRIEDIGLRPERKYHGHAMVILFPDTVEVAGNFLFRTGGAGIFVFGGKGSGKVGTTPFSRVLVHHNKVIDPLLNTNDWGGIEIWQGGPSYVFNNISGNPGGYWHWKHKQSLETGNRNSSSARFGFAYYLDGAFKSYVFNNVAWGKSSDLDSPLLNTAAFQGIHGFLNTYFHNTAFRFAVGSRRQAPVAGRNFYLGNIWIDITEGVFHHDRIRRADAEANAEHVGENEDAYAYDTLTYGANVIQANPSYIGVFESTGVAYPDVESFASALELRGAYRSDVGILTERPVVIDAEAHEFRLAPESPAIDEGVRVFVPWALSGVVGEWNFIRNQSDPGLVRDEHWLMDPTHVSREDYHSLPRPDLEIVGADPAAYLAGPLEDWAEGALSFDGTRFGRVPAEKLNEDVSYIIKGKEYTYPSFFLPGLDMQENNFLIELVFRTEPGHIKGTLVSKVGESGYQLLIDDHGRARLDLIYLGSVICSRASDLRVNDGEWKHLIVEVERDRLQPDNRPIHLYLDGQPSDGEWQGVMPTKYIQFINTSDFLVGGGGDHPGLHGAIDFLRVARGTLRDAHTTIGELWAWEFDGPQFRDTMGNRVTGLRRDAGAFEWQPSDPD